MSDWKPDRIDASALIPLTGLGGNHPGFKNFFSMRDASEISMMQASAPGDHRIVDQHIKASGKVHEAAVPRRKLGFGTGARVRDVMKRKKGVIIQASAGHMRKSKTPVHKIADSNGNTWLAKETDLDLIL